MFYRFLLYRLQVLLLVQVGLEVAAVLSEEVKHLVLFPAHSISVVCAFFVGCNLASHFLLALMSEKWLYVFVLFFFQAICNEASVILILSGDGRNLGIGYRGLHLCGSTNSTSISHHFTSLRSFWALYLVGKLIIHLLRDSSKALEVHSVTYDKASAQYILVFFFDVVGTAFHGRLLLTHMGIIQRMTSCRLPIALMKLARVDS